MKNERKLCDFLFDNMLGKLFRRRDFKESDNEKLRNESKERRQMESSNVKEINDEKALIEWEIFVFVRSYFDTVTITEFGDKHLGVSEAMLGLGQPLI